MRKKCEAIVACECKKCGITKIGAIIEVELPCEHKGITLLIAKASPYRRINKAYWAKKKSKP
jgi:hypothetical protein